jgi:hypothetical protein
MFDIKLEDNGNMADYLHAIGVMRETWPPAALRFRELITGSTSCTDCLDRVPFSVRSLRVVLPAEILAQLMSRLLAEEADPKREGVGRGYGLVRQ